MGETCEHPTTRRGGREWDSDPDSDPEVRVRSTDRLSRVCRFRVWCLHATAATATPPLIGAKPLNSKEIAFHPVFSFQDDGLMAESSSVFQRVYQAGVALGRLSGAPARVLVNVASRTPPGLCEHGSGLEKKGKRETLFYDQEREGKGMRVRGWDHYDMILNTARVVVTH